MILESKDSKNEFLIMCTRAGLIVYAYSIKRHEADIFSTFTSPFKLTVAETNHWTASRSLLFFFFSSLFSFC